MSHTQPVPAKDVRDVRDNSVRRAFAYCRKSQEDKTRQVLSILSQHEQIDRILEADPKLVLVEVIDEEMSAKSPGRPKFNAMLDRVEAGEADTIIAWAPHRLARNAVDTGRIFHLLDSGVLKDLRFTTHTFENNANGKFMLAILFAQSKHYVDNLSAEIRNAVRRRVESGWHSSVPPLGYRTTGRVKKTVVTHRVYFPLVRRMFDLILFHSHSVHDVARIAREEWGMRTPKKLRSGGVPIGVGTIHRMLRNPFYAGFVKYHGALLPGRHKPLVTPAEFAEVAKIISRPCRRRPKRYAFAYTGQMRCGACGLRITAEHKTNKYGSRYVYYHCTKRNLIDRCKQPSVELAGLERSIHAFLKQLVVPPGVEAWVLDHIQEDATKAAELATARSQSLALSAKAIDAELRELTSMRMRSLINDDEFLRERNRLQAERQTVASQTARPASGVDRFELLRLTFTFSKYAADWFSEADEEHRRLIFEIAGSNPTLVDKKLSVQAAKCFVLLSDLASYHDVRRDRDDVRTSVGKDADGWARAREVVDQIARDADIRRITEGVRALVDRHMQTDCPPPADTHIPTAADTGG